MSRFNTQPPVARRLPAVSFFRPWSNRGRTKETARNRRRLSFEAAPYINYNTTERFISKLMAPKLVRSFFFCGVYI